MQMDVGLMLWVGEVAVKQPFKHLDLNLLWEEIGVDDETYLGHSECGL